MTYSLGKWRSSRSDNHKFLTHQSLWKRQYFFVSLHFEDELKGLGHFSAGSSFFCIRIFSTGISKGVKFSFFFDDVSRALLLALASVRLSLRSLFLPWDSLLYSFFRLPVNPSTVSASSPFMYFCALNNKFVIEVGGVFPREKMRSRLFNPAWKVVIITWSSASSIFSIALLNHFTYSLWVSPSCYFTVNRYEILLQRVNEKKKKTKAI